jgi:hypothetical protein
MVLVSSAYKNPKLHEYNSPEAGIQMRMSNSPRKHTRENGKLQICRK